MPRPPSSSIDKLQGADWYALFKDLHAGLILDLSRQQERGRQALRAAPRSSMPPRCALSKPTARWLSRNGSKDEALKVFKAFDTSLPRHPLIVEEMATLEKASSCRRWSTAAGRRCRSALRARRGAGRRGGEDLGARLSAARALSRAAISRWRCCRLPISTSR